MGLVTPTCLDVSKYRREVIGLSPVGDAWTEVYRSRRTIAADEFSEELELLSAVITQCVAGKVMQVGCAGGGELWQLAQRFPHVEFVGLDINEHSILRNRVDFAGTPNLRWVAGDVFATDYLEHEKPQVLFTSGTAEYFTEGELESFLQRSQLAGVKAVCFYEPITQIGFDYRKSCRSTTRGMMAFNHPYGRKLRAVGARAVQESVSSGEDPHVISILCLGYF